MVLLETLRGVGAAIKTISPEATVTTEQMEQSSAEEDIFYISPGVVMTAQMGAHRRRYTIQVFAQFFPGRHSPYGDGLGIASSVMEALEVIDTDTFGCVAGEVNGMTSGDATWTIDVTYTIYNEQGEEGPAMEELLHEQTDFRG